jgi:hypothetical protein
MIEPIDSIHDLVLEAMKIRNSMCDSMLRLFMEQNGLSIDEVILVEELKENNIRYYYAERKNKELGYGRKDL